MLGLFRNKVLLLFAVLLGSYTPVGAAGFDILVIQNEANEFSQRFLSGFSSKSNERISVIKFADHKGKALTQEIKKRSPDLILTLGDLPIYSAVSELPTIPFIVANLYSMDLENRSNVILVENRLPIFEEISMLKLLFPNIKTIGTVYNPDYTEKVFADLESAAKRLDIQVIPLKVSSENDVGAFVAAFSGKIDAFYLISDITTTHPKSSQPLFSFMREQKIPVLSTQYDHADEGAVLSVSADPIQLGAAAWERAYQTINDGKVSNRKIYLSPTELNLSISMSSLNIFNVDIKLFKQLLEQATEKGFTVTVRR